MELFLKVKILLLETLERLEMQGSNPDAQELLNKINATKLERNTVLHNEEML